MPAQFQPRSIRESGSGSSRKKSRKPIGTASSGSSPVGKSLAQARLDRIMQPTDMWLRSCLRWTTRFRNPADWPDPALDQRRWALQADLERLEALLAQPPEDWTAERWLMLHDRAQSWAGQLYALEQTLAQRRRAGST